METLATISYHRFVKLLQIHHLLCCIVVLTNCYGYISDYFISQYCQVAMDTPATILYHSFVKLLRMHELLFCIIVMLSYYGYASYILYSLFCQVATNTPRTNCILVLTTLLWISKKMQQLLFISYYVLSKRMTDKRVLIMTQMTEYHPFGKFYFSMQIVQITSM